MSLLNIQAFSAEIAPDTFLKVTGRFHRNNSWGGGLACMALSGRTALIGADETIEGLQAAGAAYFFTEDSSGHWIQQQRVIDPGITALDDFGSAVALDGDTALIGAHGNGVGEQQFRGAVYAYARDAAGQWHLKQTFYGTDSDTGDQFGSAVDLQGEVALIGAPYASINGTPDTTESGEGKAYFFIRGPDGTWSQKQKLLDPEPHLGDNFGYPVALDGATAAISAPVANSNGVQHSGVVYIYRRDKTGVWNQEARLTASDPKEWLRFGSRIALSGNTILVTAKHDTVNGQATAGAVYIFVRDADGVWTQQARLTASDAAEEDRFGAALALENDVALISSPTALVVPVESRQVVGVVYKFVRDPATAHWTQQQELATPDPTATDRGGIGSCLAMDGNLAMTSDGNAIVDGVKDAGAIYMLKPVSGPATDLSLQVTADTSAPKIGQTLTYRLRVTNNNAKQAADHVVITDPLPTTTGFAGASTVCSNANGSVTCDLDTLGPGAVAEAVIKVTPTETGRLLNIARVSADQPEHNTRDNIGYAVVTVQLAPSPPPPGDPAKGGGGASGWLSFIWLAGMFVLSKSRDPTLPRSHPPAS